MFKFSWIFEPKFQWFLDRFLDSKRKHRFCKNSAPACTGARFLGFRRIWNQQKINKKSMQNKNEKMIGTNCKKYPFWYGFGKGFGRFSEGLEGIKVRSKESFFLYQLVGWFAFIWEGVGTPRCSHVRPNCDSIFEGCQFGSRLGVAVAFGTRFGSDLEKV